MTPEKEKKNKRVGMMVSLGVHLAVLLLFAFLMAWRAPDPPLPEYGIELNFGTSDVGTGEIQPPAEVTPSESEEEAAPEDVPEVLEEVEQSQETPVVNEEVSEVEAETEAVEEVFDDPESSDIVEQADPVPNETKEEKKEEVEEVKPTPVEKKKEEEKPAEKVEEPVKQPADGAKGEEGESKTANANQGDKTDEVGDQGNEEGDIDARALYGNPGGGGGTALKMAGWNWDREPAPKDTSSETGRIVFEIKIDEEGEILTIRTLESTVSPSIRKIYEDEVRRLTFSKTGNLPPAPTSVGQITFIIKAK